MKESTSFAPLLEYFNSYVDENDCVLKDVDLYALKYLDYQLTCHDLHDNTDTTHRHTLFELHLFQRGHQDYVINGNKFRMNSGEFLLVPPAIDHKVVGRSKNLQKYGILFSLPSECPHCSRSVLACVEDTYLIEKTPPVMTNILKFVFENVSLQDEDAVIIIRNSMAIFMKSFFTCLNKRFGVDNETKVQYKPKMRNDTQLFDQIEGYIKENLASLSMEKVAKHFYISTRQLNRRLNAHFGMSYCQLVDKLRMDCSRNLLCYSDLSIETIAYQVGASNPSNFIRFFKRLEGMSPTQYRKQFHQLSENTQKKGGGD